MQTFLVEMVDIAQLDVTRKRRGTLVVDVEADLLSVIFEVEFVVVVISTNLGRVDRE